MTATELDATFWDGLRESCFGAGWAKPTPSLWPEPRRDFLPATFRYRSAARALRAARPHVPPELSERRNLICVNPHEGNTYATVGNLVAAYQLVAPGESARSHRHTPNALRLIIDVADSAYTIVEGVRIDMAADDIVLTPGWQWHGHVNDGDSEAIWIDFLDVPLIQSLGPMFFQPHPEGLEPVRTTDPSSPMRIRPSAVVAGPGGRSRTVRLPASAMPTIGLELIELAAEQAISRRQCTVSHLYAALDDGVRIEVDGHRRVLTLDRGDIAAVPGWTAHRLHTAAAEGARLLSVSDEPMLAALGLLRTAGDS